MNWWRFNDHTVTLEVEEVVFKESFGGNDSAKSAYCLIYSNKHIDEML